MWPTYRDSECRPERVTADSSRPAQLHTPLIPLAVQELNDRTEELEGLLRALATKLGPATRPVALEDPKNQAREDTHCPLYETISRLAMQIDSSAQLVRRLHDALEL